MSALAEKIVIYPVNSVFIEHCSMSLGKRGTVEPHVRTLQIKTNLNDSEFFPGFFNVKVIVSV